MKKSLAAVLFLAASMAMAADVPALSAKKRETIRTLLDIMGVARLADAMIDQMFTQFAKNTPSVPLKAWNRLRSRMKGAELIELMTPVYDKYYTLEDLEAMIAFYRTPVGQKVVRTLPDVSREGFQVGQEWGRRKGEQVMKELRSEGLVK
ncbi:MAG TPA: DUF2059 domain-containing protein [Thermoanaerobaculia bacterium]|nr:DUF2059 domain-containing protein [Thermoanaerobaculia bacterium]